MDYGFANTEPEKGISSKTGTLENSNQDELDMQRLGNKQEFQRNFRFLSILGFTCTLMATWESILLTSTYGLTDGGKAGLIYIYIASFIGFFASVISMAEIASMAPTSGGQYHWVSEFAHGRSQRFLSYITGWMSVLGWQAAFASICFMCGTLIQGFADINYSGYNSQRWHGTLLTMAIALVGTFVNTFLAKCLASLEGLILVIHIFGFFGILIPLWVTGDVASNSSVWAEFSNIGGWQTTGLAVVIGQLTPIFSFLGPDAATHMAEEIKDASRIVPWCMVTTAVINGSLGFVMLITFLYTMGNDVEAAINDPSGFAFIAAFENATGSTAAATGLACIILVLEICSAISILATSSRQIFAFARDNALPFSRFFAYVHPGTQIPIWSVLTTTLITMLLSLINIGSTEAFNAIASVAISALFCSYLIAIICFAFARIRPEGLPPTRFSLGKFGMPINLFSIGWLTFSIVFSFFPTTRVVDPVSMNWSILVFGAVVIFAIVQYIVHGHRTYVSPVTKVDKIM